MVSVCPWLPENPFKHNATLPKNVYLDLVDVSQAAFHLWMP